MESNFASVSVIVEAPLAHVWTCFNAPEHITQWNFASTDWCCPSADNDLQVGGKRNTRMEAKDGSFGFDFCGMYTLVENEKCIELRLEDDRKMVVLYEEIDHKTHVTEKFELENENPAEMQKQGWQAILDNFRQYAIHYLNKVNNG